MRASKLIFGALVLSLANMAMAGVTAPLGTSLGFVLGSALGAVLGTVLGGAALGAAVPIASAGLLAVAAASLLIGIHMVRRKQQQR